MTQPCTALEACKPCEASEPGEPSEPRSCGVFLEHFFGSLWGDCGIIFGETVQKKVLPSGDALYFSREDTFTLSGPAAEILGDGGPLTGLTMDLKHISPPTDIPSGHDLGRGVRFGT